MNFAKLIRLLRDDAGLSQGQLAKAAGLSLSAVRAFEYGNREPTYGTLVKLSRGLGVGLGAFDPDAKPARRNGTRKKQGK